MSENFVIDTINGKMVLALEGLNSFWGIQVQILYFAVDISEILKV